MASYEQIRKEELSISYRRITYISQSRFAMIDMGNDGHVPYVELVVHDGPHLFGSKVHLQVSDLGGRR